MMDVQSGLSPEFNRGLPTGQPKTRSDATRRPYGPREFDLPIASLVGKAVPAAGIIGNVMIVDQAPRGLYVHVPFCVRKCAYCDFCSVVPKSTNSFSQYLSALDREAAMAPAGQFKTVYIGGGTPTILPPHDLESLLELLRRRFDLTRIEEFTVEANPGVLRPETVRVLRGGGVNRISLGVQSMLPSVLKVLGRIHGPAEVYEAVDLLRSAELQDLSVDLIFGIPNQRLSEWESDLRAVLDLRPEHISAYGLMIVPDTPLGRQTADGTLPPVAEESYVAMFQAARRVLLSAGYEHYEISNYALPRRRCHHNVLYWRNRAYLGLGPSAASYINGRRWTNVADLEEYFAMLRRGDFPVAQQECLSPERRAGETAMLNLRTCNGIRVSEFRRNTGFDPRSLFQDAIRTHCLAGRLECEGDHIRLTELGMPVADSVLADFLM